MCSWCSDEQLKLGTYRPGTNHNAIINRVLNLLYSYIRSNAHIRRNNDFKHLVKVICIQHEASDWGKRLKIVGSIENWHLLESNHKWLLGCFYQKANIFNTFFHQKLCSYIFTPWIRLPFLSNRFKFKQRKTIFEDFKNVWWSLRYKKRWYELYQQNFWFVKNVK